VHAIDSDAEKEEADADLEGCRGEGVEDFAEEPVLRIISIVLAC
jgi:hypothetical protein